jgi:hypothetical protein
MDDDLRAFGDGATETLHAECPECGRTEQIHGLIKGNAWLLSHLQAEHPAALPAFEGVAEEDDD